MILILEIGGTNARHCIMSTLNKSTVYPKTQTQSANFESILEYIEYVIKESKMKAENIVIAIAGPVKNN
jgi:glucokinase